MIARRNRLARTDFPILLKTGKRLTSKHFSIVYNNTPKGVAVVVSKKVAKTAIARHKIKRQIRAILHTKQTPSGVIVFMRAENTHPPFSHMIEELGTLLAQALKNT